MTTGLRESKSRFKYPISLPFLPNFSPLLLRLWESVLSTPSLGSPKVVESNISNSRFPHVIECLNLVGYFLSQNTGLVRNCFRWFDKEVPVSQKFSFSRPHWNNSTASHLVNCSIFPNLLKIIAGSFEQLQKTLHCIFTGFQHQKERFIKSFTSKNSLCNLCHPAR